LFEKHDFCSYIIHYLLQKDQKWTKNVILPCRFSQIDILLGKTFFPRNSHGKFFRFPHFPFPMGKKFGWEIGTTMYDLIFRPKVLLGKKVSSFRYSCENVSRSREMKVTYRNCESGYCNHEEIKSCDLAMSSL